MYTHRMYTPMYTLYVYSVYTVLYTPYATECTHSHCICILHNDKMYKYGLRRCIHLCIHRMYPPMYTTYTLYVCSVYTVLQYSVYTVYVQCIRTVCTLYMAECTHSYCICILHNDKITLFILIPL
jgi:hypothetical protein